MGVAEDEFVAQFVADVGNIELSLLVAYLGVEAHVQQHVAQFLADVLYVVLYQGVAQLVGFFYRVHSQAFVGLLTVPRTLLSQFVQHVEHPPECGHLFFFCMHSECKNTKTTFNYQLIIVSL